MKESRGLAALIWTLVWVSFCPYVQLDVSSTESKSTQAPCSSAFKNVSQSASDVPRSTVLPRCGAVGKHHLSWCREPPPGYSGRHRQLERLQGRQQPEWVGQHSSSMHMVGGSLQQCGLGVRAVSPSDLSYPFACTPRLLGGRKEVWGLHGKPLSLSGSAMKPTEVQAKSLWNSTSRQKVSWCISTS